MYNYEREQKKRASGALEYLRLFLQREGTEIKSRTVTPIGAKYVVADGDEEEQITVTKQDVLIRYFSEGEYRGYEIIFRDNSDLHFEIRNTLELLEKPNILSLIKRQLKNRETGR